MIGTKTSRRYLARTALAVALVIASGTFGLRGPASTPTADALAAPLNAGGEYHAITPIRILDTAVPKNDVAPLGPKYSGPTGKEFTFDALGKGDLPKFVDGDNDKLDDNVLALAVNVTVDQGTSGGYVQMYAAGAAGSDSSLANFSPRQTIPNFAIVRPGDAGKLAAQIITTEAGTARVIVDVFGYFTTSNSKDYGARIVTTNPSRIFDSREKGKYPGANGPVPGGSQVGLQVRGATTADGKTVVPNDANVTGVIVNLTGVNILPNSAATYLSMLPTALVPDQSPGTSNLNLVPQDIKASTGIVPIGPDGKIYIYQHAGAADVVVDVMGYLVDGKPVTSTTGRLVPLVKPFRAGDTRDPKHFNHKEGPGQAEDWSFEKFIKDVKINGQWVGNQQGFIANFTATDLSRQYPTVPVGSYLTVSPPPSNGVSKPPDTSNVNLGETQTIPNMLVARYGSNSADARCGAAQCIRVYNEAGYVNYLVDVSAVILA